MCKSGFTGKGEIWTGVSNVRTVSMRNGCVFTLEDVGLALTSVIDTEDANNVATEHIDIPSVVIGGFNVEAIGAEALKGCTKLKSVVIPGGVKNIRRNAFADCASLNEVFYRGSVVEWSGITVESGNTALNDARKYFFSVDKPTAEGDFWHYDENSNSIPW